MKIPRRRFLELAAGAVALPAVSRIAKAQAYPTRPVRIIVGFPPGGGADILARLIAQSLSERLGQPFVVDNRPGAGTTIATASVVRAPADGYTLLIIGGSVAITATLYENLNYNFIRDIVPIASIARGPNIIVVNPSWSVSTVPQLISYAKANPGRVTMGFGGIGSTPHVAGALFKVMTGVNMSNVPYRGEAQAITDVLGGQIQVCFSTLGGSIEYVRAGKLRALWR